MSNRPADRALSETKQIDEKPSDQPDKLTPSATPESGKSSFLDRLRDLVVRPGIAAILWVLLLLASGVLSTDIVQAPPWPQLATDLFVPMTVAAFSWWLHLIARARQETFELQESDRRDNLMLTMQEKQQEHEESLQKSQKEHEEALLESQNAHDAALQTRQEELAAKLKAHEAELERDLEEQYQEFRRRLEDVRQDSQIKLAKQRDRMTARLSIASHVGDIDGHLSAIEGILSAMRQTAPNETADSQDELAAVASTGESAFEIAQGVIRIPERLLRLIHLPDSQRQ